MTSATQARPATELGRTATTAALIRHLRNRHLSFDECNRRLFQVYLAGTHDELMRLIADLPPLQGKQTAPDGYFTPDKGPRTKRAPARTAATVTSEPKENAMSNANVRISDIDRIDMATLLGEHMAAGRLTIAEYDERVAQAYQARTYADLKPLLADLPMINHAAAAVKPRRTTLKESMQKQRQKRHNLLVRCSVIGTLAIAVAMMLTGLFGVFLTYGHEASIVYALVGVGGMTIALLTAVTVASDGPSNTQEKE